MKRPGGQVRLHIRTWNFSDTKPNQFSELSVKHVDSARHRIGMPHLLAYRP
jgi:hypothetical protein